jgi:iron complex outermembrane receptor protein
MGGVARPRGPAGARAAAALVVGWLSLAVHPAAAQGSDPAPAPGTAPPAANDAEAGQRLAPVSITGNRADDVQERRNSTTSKIIVGRDEIERFGDATLGDVLKRLPGVTSQGPPGRGGAIGMRGLGNGYTQILLDGERVPADFPLDSLTPEQIERIEILRAPTAETVARAIADKLNIITRGGYTRRVNNARVSTAFENGSIQPSVLRGRATRRQETSSSTPRSACSTWTATTAARRRRSTAASTTARLRWISSTTSGCASAAAA